MPKRRDCARVEQQPESLAGIDVLREIWIDNADVFVAGADEFHVIRANKADMLPGSQPLARRDRHHGDMHGIPSPITVFNQIAKCWAFFHLRNR